ncbi:2324_t:CDS:2 [Gigaspora margarita]|uniref:2324_t:CDS:1 n=1 Tax=Gigaspora margarita TaxID=4874 RepID=A0ABN7W0F0_GIGMA|nr:2324_t:CDS:2 [Gigaspora margarita]
MQSGEIQFINASPEKMGIYKSICEDSLDLDNELFSNPPYPLAMDIEELTSPPKTSRKAIRFRKHPHLSTPPRPQNAWVLFRRNYTELLKLKGDKMNNGEISRVAADDIVSRIQVSPKKRSKHNTSQTHTELHSLNSEIQIDTTPEKISFADKFSEEVYFLKVSNPHNDFLQYNEHSNVENLEMINNPTSQQAIVDQTFDQDGFDISEFINLELTY